MTTPDHRVAALHHYFWSRGHLPGQKACSGHRRVRAAERKSNVGWESTASLRLVLKGAIPTLQHPVDWVGNLRKYNIQAMTPAGRELACQPSVNGCILTANLKLPSVTLLHRFKECSNVPFWVFFQERVSTRGALSVSVLGTLCIRIPCCLFWTHSAISNVCINFCIQSFRHSTQGYPMLAS